MADVAFSTAPPPPPPQAVTGVSPETLHMQRMMALALMKEGSSYDPVRSWTQGLARASNGIMGGLEARWDAEKEMQGRQLAANQRAAMFGLPQTPIQDMPDSPFGYVTRGLGMGGGSTPGPAAAPVAAPAAVSASGPIASYIQQAALARGIDPAVALRVANVESGLNPANPGDKGPDGRPSSFNLFQLHYGNINPQMPHGGMGDDFTKTTGLDARDPANWKAVTDFALDNAAKNGWGAWATTRDKLGIGNFTGIKSGGAQQANAADVAAPSSQTAGLSLPPGQTGFGSVVDQPAPRSLVGATPELQAYAAANPAAFSTAPSPAPAPVTGPGPQGPLAGDFGMMGSAVGPQPAPVVPSTGPLPGDVPVPPSPVIDPAQFANQMPALSVAATPAPPSSPGPSPSDLLATLGAGSAPQAPGPMDPSIAAHAAMAPAPVPSPTIASDGNPMPAPPATVAMDQPVPVPAPGVPLPPVRPADLGMSGANAGPVPATPQDAIVQALMATPSGRNSMNQSPTAFNLAQAASGPAGTLPPAQAAIAKALVGRSSPVSPAASSTGSTVAPSASSGGSGPTPSPQASPGAVAVAGALSGKPAPTGGATPTAAPASSGAAAVTNALAGQASQAPAPASLPTTAAPSPGAAAVTAALVPGGGRTMGGANIGALLALASNPWASPADQALATQLIAAQTTPHKIEFVENKGTGQMEKWDSITGQDLGPAGAPGLPRITMKDTAGNEYSVNPLDHNDVIRSSDLVQPNGVAAPANGAKDPYASPFAPTMKHTDVMNDYEGMLAQARANGTPADKIPSFNDYQLALKHEGAQTTVYNQESAAAKKVGEAVGSNVAEYIDAAKDSRTKLQALNMIGDILKRSGGNISTGPGADMMLKAKQSLANAFPGSFGDSAGPTEMLQKLSTQLATADAKSLASRPTQFDFATYLRNNPGIQMSVEGQKALVAIKAQQAQHDIELGNLALKKENSQHPENWGDVVSDYDKKNPIINPITAKPFDPNSSDFPEVVNAKPNGADSTTPAARVTKDQYKDLPSGSLYIPADDPNGQVRRKP
jgi:hypothetical protein